MKLTCDMFLIVSLELLGQAGSKFKHQGAAHSLEAAAPSPAKALGWPPQCQADCGIITLVQQAMNEMTLSGGK